MLSEKTKNIILDVTKDVLNKVGFEADVVLSENTSSDNKFYIVSVDSAMDLSILIGKNGQNLNAFEHLVRLIYSRKVTKDSEESVNFIVDVNDYRKSRTNYLISLAKEVAQRVGQTQKAEALLPMSSYERRLVHTELAAHHEVQTESIGQEPMRRIVVKPI